MLIDGEVLVSIQLPFTKRFIQIEDGKLAVIEVEREIMKMVKVELMWRLELVEVMVEMEVIEEK